MNRGERIRRWVDGELDAVEETALLADASRSPALARALDDARMLAAELASLRSEHALPPEDLVERSVRGAITARAAYEARPERRWDWLWRPRSVRVRPLSLLLSGALVLAGLLLMLNARQLNHDGRRAFVEPENSSPAAHVPAATPPGAPSELAVVPDPASVVAAPEIAAQQVPVRFVLPAGRARSVAVAGDFNGWQASATPLQDGDGDGVFVGSVRLPPGTYAYMFVVDGKRWVADPYAESFRDDGFGNRNAVLRIN